MPNAKHYSTEFLHEIRLQWRQLTKWELKEKCKLTFHQSSFCQHKILAFSKYSFPLTRLRTSFQVARRSHVKELSSWSFPSTKSKNRTRSQERLTAINLTEHEYFVTLEPHNFNLNKLSTGNWRLHVDEIYVYVLSLWGLIPKVNEIYILCNTYRPDLKPNQTRNPHGTRRNFIPRK